jgi:hypothetical protein
MGLAMFHHEHSVPLTINFVHVLYHVLNCTEFAEVIGPPSSNIATVFNFVCCASLTRVDIDRVNRHSQFPFPSFRDLCDLYCKTM